MTIGLVIIAFCMRLVRYGLIGKRAKPGWERVYSKSFLRRNLATSLYHSSIKALDGTVLLYMVNRLVFGTDIDVKSSFTPQPEEPDLTKIGRCTFGANGVRVRNTLFYTGGIVRYGKVTICDFSMILDRAVVSPNTSIKKSVMVGPITFVNEDTNQEEGTLLLGTPALNLNRKADVEMEITSEPMIHLFLQYFIIMYFKYLVLLINLAAFYANGIIFKRIQNNEFFALSKNAAFAINFGIFPLSLMALVVVLLTICLAVKWIIIGNFKRLQSVGLIAVDTWHSFQWLVCNLMVHIACAVPLQLLDEFWLTATFWKLMGAKIGKNTLIDPDVLLFEVDLLEIGDNCRIEEEATLLCHKFNDGGLKLDKISIPSSTYIGTRAVIFPGSEICDEYVTMLPLTPLNPGEKLTAGHWQGSPAERVNIKSGKLLPGARRRSTMLLQRSSISTNDIA